MTSYEKNALSVLNLPAPAIFKNNESGTLTTRKGTGSPIQNSLANVSVERIRAAALAAAYP
jgi:hypothetical protein